MGGLRSLALLAISLLALEVVLRLLLGGHEHAGLFYFERDGLDDGRCVGLKPGAEVDFTGLYLRIPPVRLEVNALGYRGPERPRAKPPHVSRIAVVGDSFAYGFSVRAEESIPAYLEAALRERRGAGVEVLNFGIPGANLADSVAQTRYFASRWQPDLVLLLLFYNDLDESMCSWVLWPWNLIAKISHHVYLARLPVMFAVLWPDRSGDDAQASRLRTELGGLAGVSREAGASLAVVVLADPVAPFFERSAGEASPLDDVLDSLGVPWLDARSWWFDGPPETRLPVIPRDYHFTAEGNREAAARVAKWLSASVEGFAAEPSAAGAAGDPAG